MSDVKNLEIDEAVVKAVAAEVTKTMPAVDTEAIATKVAAQVAEASEKAVKKDIHAAKDVEVLSGFADMSKEMRFAQAVRATKSGNTAKVAEYNAYSVKAWGKELQKADYQNVTVGADGGSLVPDPEFVAEVERLTDDYGVASRLANIRRTDRDSVTLLSGTNEVSFTKTGEATAQNAQKLTFGATTATLDKYIATLIMTSELVEDSAINIWQDATQEIARARAKLIDQLVFTDATYGLLSASLGDAYKTQTVGAAITDFDADDAMDAKYKVVSSVRRNGRYFMHPTVWNALRQTKEATTGGYLFGDVNNEVKPMIDGVPVELVDVLPAVGDITANESFAVFGDLSRIKVHVKRVLETKIFDSGVVPDAGGSDINLISQDAWALRATLRAVPQTRFEGAFVIIGTGTVS